MSIVVLYQNSYINVLFWFSTLYHRYSYINISCYGNLNIVVVLSCVASYCYAFFNILRSFRVCVHARVFVHAYEPGRNYIHACNKKFFEGRPIMFKWKTNPLWRKLVTDLKPKRFD